ncbi:Down-regulated in metastasis [Trichostrongylus colubriformis]|uniref:Down-regulated in metastasis n=1 Tax=Trichostrongylus colubriformis TaxID=6319 RepID=A0AAN8FYY5_TRICO
MEDQDEAPPPKKQRFKHLTFNQCVASIGGDSAKFSKRLSHRPDDSELFFTEALTKWNDQDFGVHYTSFVDSLPCDELSTHAQLLYHKNTITKLLLKYLQDQKCKSVQAFCELLSALVRDLKEDFRDDMWDFFDALTNVLDLGERDVESVEAAFFTLSLIVKIMWRTLIKNFVSSFVHFIPLFGSSRPYVRRFAAESFSFVMRKSSKLSTISQHVVEQAYKVQDERLTEGCAELFFYVCKGVAGGFHSAAKEQIGRIITGVFKLSDPHVREYGMTILEKAVQFIVTYVQKTSKGDLSFLEVTLIGMMENASTLEHCTSLMRLLSLCFVQRKWKNLFSSQERLLSAIEKVMTTPFFELNSEFIDFFSKSIHAVFFDEEWGSRVGQTCAKIISFDDSFSLMLDLFDNVRDMAYFDSCILPVIGKLSQQLLSKEPTLSPRLLNLYSSICMKERPIQNAFSRSPGPIFDVAHHQCVKEHVTGLIGRLASIERSVVASVLLIWPWIFDVSDQIVGVDNVVSFLKELLSGDYYSLEASQLALIAGSSLYQVDKLALRNIESGELERFVRCTNCCESSLRLYRIYLECNENALGEGELKRVSDLLTPCYFNPNAYVRKCALEILNSFDFTVNGIEEEDNKYPVSSDENLFAIMLAAERCDIIDSRGRLLQFRKLIFDHHQRYMPKGSDVTYDHVILRISLSQFFVQFTKLWPSMYEILESFARGMDIDGFWSIMAEVLDQVNDGCRELEEKESTIRFLPWCDNHDRFDYRSARIQILKFMANIPDIAQRRTRILSPMILKIYESDYLPLIVENLGSLSKGDQLENAEEADIRAGAAEESPNVTYETRVHVTKALCAFLDVYAKFTDPKSVYLEPKMRNMYEHLLIVDNDMVQKSALACIFSYRDKSLLPYKENFERLLDEKTFREQLVLFTINEEENNSIVHLDHRQAVMHVLLRFLYGKLWIKTKRHLAESRRAAIFRYLGGCRPQELLEFLKILFAPVLEVIGTEDQDYKRMDVLCADNEVLFKMDFGKISRCVKMSWFHIIVWFL